MSVQSYLQALSKNLVLNRVEKDSIKTSIGHLQKNLEGYFGDNLDNHFIFGSYTRGTILPRWADEKSDVDYMVVFDNADDCKPQTFMNRLRKFVEKYYHASQIRQSHPTIVLELNHIKFELVPAHIERGFFVAETIYIPAPQSEYLDWVSTNPNDFNEKLVEKNKDNTSIIKPMIRLVKHWNARNGYIFPSYSLEQDAVSYWYLFSSNLKEYFFSFMNSLDCSRRDAKWRRDKIKRAKQIISQAKAYERRGEKILAEEEIKKLFE